MLYVKSGKKSRNQFITVIFLFHNCVEYFKYIRISLPIENIPALVPSVLVGIKSFVAKTHKLSNLEYISFEFLKTKSLKITKTTKFNKKI